MRVGVRESNGRQEDQFILHQKSSTSNTFLLPTQFFLSFFVVSLLLYLIDNFRVFPHHHLVLVHTRHQGLLSLQGLLQTIGQLFRFDVLQLDGHLGYVTKVVSCVE